MQRKLMVVLIAAGAALLVITGAVAGMLIAEDDGPSSTSAQASNGTTAPATTGKGYLGITVSYQGSGSPLRVATVVAGGPADVAGIEVGDIIRSVDGVVLRTPEQLRSAAEAKEPGTSVTITYERSDHESQARLTLGDAPVNAQIEAPAGQGAQPNPNGNAGNGQGRLGVRVQDITSTIKARLNLKVDKGIVVTDVTAGSAGATAGLQRADVILNVGGTAVSTSDELQKAVSNAPANKQVDLAVQRGSDQLTLKVTLPAKAGASTTTAPGLDQLPQALREQVQKLIDEGKLNPTQVDRIAKSLANRGDALRMGVVKSANPLSLTITQQPQNSDVTIALKDTSVILRGSSKIDAIMLRPGETVMVISMDGGASAFSVYAFGVIS